jgi:hypothetical protein
MLVFSLSHFINFRRIVGLAVFWVNSSIWDWLYNTPTWLDSARGGAIGCFGGIGVIAYTLGINRQARIHNVFKVLRVATPPC